MAGDYKRLIILNRLLSTSVTRAKQKDEAPIHGAFELLKLVEPRVKSDIAVEFFGADDHENDEARIAGALGRSFVKLRDVRFDQDDSSRFIVALVEYVNTGEKSMPVVDMKTFRGRELEGNETERGAYTSHLVIKVPLDEEYDDASYRCAIEVNSISRKSMEYLLCRQLRRIASDWEFAVWTQLKTKRKQEDRKYYPKLELAADVGRALSFTVGQGAEISQVVFTKRHEKKRTATKTDIQQAEYYANVTVRVAGTEGPEDPTEKVAWFSGLRKAYERMGYETRTYFRHPRGGLVSGEMSDDVATAADIVMCPKEHVSLSSEPKRWCAEIVPEIVDRMKTLLNSDGLWEHGQQS